ncbi:MAG: DNA-binding protein [Paraclostridium sp.]
MTTKDNLKQILQLQDEGDTIEDIAIKLNMEVKALRRFLNQNGYKSAKGKYVKKEDDKKDNTVNQLEISVGKSKKKNIKSIEKTSKDSNVKYENKKPKTSVKKSKSSSKVNMSVEDMDKLCEVYDWYLSIKDLKTLKAKKKSNNKDIELEQCDMNNLKSTSIKIDKSTWEEFERLCSNSAHTKQEIVTQAIKNFLKEYKYLL